MTNPENLKIALKRYRIIQPFLDDGVSLTKLAELNDLSVRTLQGSVANFE